MKWDFENVKKFLKSKYARPVLFFGFYFIFFTITIVLFSGNNNANKDNKESNIWDNVSNKYEYLYEISINDSNVIKLEGKRYNNKNVFIKENGTTKQQVYTFYNEVYLNENNSWLPTDNFIVVDNNFDNELLNLDYYKVLLIDETPDGIENNFDGSKSEVYDLGDKKITVVNDNNKLKKIDVTYGIYDISLQYRNINNVSDFVVKK